MRLLTAALGATLVVVLLTQPAAADSDPVVIDMPPPPPPPARTDAASRPASGDGTADQTGAAPASAPAPDGPETVGEVALRRFGAPRAQPRSPRWSGWGWGYGPAHGFPHHGIGGYRISLSPYRLYAERAWNGGYVVPSWVYVRFGPRGRW